MIPSRIVETKRDGGILIQDDLDAFLRGYLEGSVPDYQMATFLMAVHFRGPEAEEAEVLVRCMLGSGPVLDLVPHGAGPGRIQGRAAPGRVRDDRPDS